MYDTRAPRWLTSREAANLLGVDRDTIKRWPIPYNQVGPKGRRRYAEADVLAWLDKTRREG